MIGYKGGEEHIHVINMETMSMSRYTYLNIHNRCLFLFTIDLKKNTMLTRELY